MVITGGIRKRGDLFVTKALATVQAFEDFNSENDPDSRRDFGIVEVEGRRICWKIEYYDAEQLVASPDPSNPAKTQRVMTLFHSSEY